MKLHDALRHSLFKTSTLDWPTPLDAALTYAARGWLVFPVHSIQNGECTCGGKKGCTPGKHPLEELVPHGLKDATQDIALIREWWTRHPLANIGVRMGTVSGIVGIDADPRHGGDKTLVELAAQNGPLPATLVSMTGGGGTHQFFQTRGLEFRSKANALGPGVDVKGEGGYLILPPSNHASGGVYKWADYSEPIADLPREWEKVMLLAGKKQSTPPVNGNASKVHEGSRDQVLTSLAGTMRRRGMSVEAIRAALWAENLAKCEPPVSDADIDRIANSVGRYQPSAPVLVTPTAAPQDTEPEPQVRIGSTREDTSNSERFADQHKDRVRYACQRGKWLVWDGCRFKPDEAGAVMELAKQTARSIYIEAAGLPEDEAPRMAKWAESTCDSKRLAAMLRLASSDPRLVVTEDKLDADDWVINSRNGVLDLRTGVLREHAKADLMTRLAGAAYDPEAQCPRWMKFLETTFESNQELIGFLQRASGYALTGNTREQAWFFLHGSGENGKSTYISVLNAILGDYSFGASFETFCFKKNGHGIRNDLAAMKGARLVHATETTKGARLDESVIKQLTGDDAVCNARFLYREEFHFRPAFKLFLSANSKPSIVDTSHAMWRRIRLIPFTHQVKPEEKIEELWRVLLDEERDAIFTWMTKGCAAWQEQKLNPPNEVLAATAVYRSEQDLVDQFLKEKTRPGGRADSKATYKKFKDWATADQGHKSALTKNAFSRELTRLGYPTDSQFRFYLGFELIEFGDPETLKGD